MLELDSRFKAALPDGASFDRLMGVSGELFRDAPGRKTLRFEAGGKGYFIKVHTGVGWREIFKNLFQGRLPVVGARNEYLAIRRLTELGVETMRWVAYGCRGWNPAYRQSFVVTEELTDTVSLEDFCASWPLNPPPVRLKRLLIGRVAEIAGTLDENGINHRDFYLCHFLLKIPFIAVEGLHLYLIDLHRMQLRRKTPERWRVKDLAAIYFSGMEIGLTKRDRLRFVRAYRNRSLRQALAKEKSFWEKVERRALGLYASWNEAKSAGSRAGPAENETT